MSNKDIKRRSVPEISKNKYIQERKQRDRDGEQASASYDSLTLVDNFKNAKRMKENSDIVVIPQTMPSFLYS